MLKWLHSFRAHLIDEPLGASITILFSRLENFNKTISSISLCYPTRSIQPIIQFYSLNINLWKSTKHFLGVISNIYLFLPSLNGAIQPQNKTFDGSMSVHNIRYDHNQRKRWFTMFQSAILLKFELTYWGVNIQLVQLMGVIGERTQEMPSPLKYEGVETVGVAIV